MVEIVEIMMSLDFYFRFISPEACFYLFHEVYFTNYILPWVYFL